MSLLLTGMICLIVGSWLGIWLERVHAPVRAFRERWWRVMLYGDPTKSVDAYIRGDYDP